MSDQIEHQPYDDRHAMMDKEAIQRVTPPLDQDATGLNRSPMGQVPSLADQDGGFWTQEASAPVVEQTGYFERVHTSLPSRVPGQGLIHPHIAEHGIPSFGSGLNWRASVQSPVRGDLVNFDWGQDNAVFGLEISNIELRTIYAHLLETAGAVRAEMRERGMQVDL
jgi:hypothetical protein